MSKDYARLLHRGYSRRHHTVIENTSLCITANLAANVSDGKQTSSLLPRMSASIQKADIANETLLKELTRRFEPRCTRSSKGDSNPKNLALQVVALTLDLPELY
jgi:hypothetical protein